jgi:hypothetical protein
MNTIHGLPVPSPTHEPETIYFSIWPDVQPVWPPLQECGVPDQGHRRFQTLIIPRETMADMPRWLTAEASRRFGGER